MKHLIEKMVYLLDDLVELIKTETLLTNKQYLITYKVEVALVYKVVDVFQEVDA